MAESHERYIKDLTPLQRRTLAENEARAADSIGRPTVAEPMRDALEEIATLREENDRLRELADKLAATLRTAPIGDDEWHALWSEAMDHYYEANRG